MESQLQESIPNNDHPAVARPQAVRVHVPISRHAADGNIQPGHPAGRASWIWSDTRADRQTAFLRFTLDFSWTNAGPLRLHVTGDQRYQLYLDGQLLSCGPDRSDVEHWAVTTLDIELDHGTHRLSALVWYIAEARGSSRMDPKHAAGDLVAPNPPMAQMSHHSGFLLAGHTGIPQQLLDTGHAEWRVVDLTEAVSMTGPKNLGYHDIGPQFAYDMTKWHSAVGQARPACVVAGPPTFNIHGVRTPGWVLDSTFLPEQQRRPEAGGRIRAARPIQAENVPWSETMQGPALEWEDLLRAQIPVEMPAGSEIELIWDLERYACGYPDLVWSGGTGAVIALHWAEALFEAAPGDHLDAESPRGHRDVIEGKRWLGFGDTFTASGAAGERSPALWWRAGRYIRIRVTVGDQPLTIQRIGIVTTGYPLEREWSWTSSDSGWDRVMPLMARGLELGAHETWSDAPYYEQMMYVGDNLVHALSNYVGYRDHRLSRRALELLDWSRAGSLGGLVAERYPAAWRQEATTFAMLYPAMLQHFLMWRGEENYLRERLPGLRQLIESLLALRQGNGLMATVPGWPFVDWVPIWNQGCGPGVREGDSSIVNLHLVLALQSAAAIERHIGEPLLAERAEAHARACLKLILERYWDDKAEILRDTSTGPAKTSEHAQVLALLTGWLSPEQQAGCLAALRARRLDAACTIYFSHYLLEAFSRAGEATAFFDRLSFWRELPDKGFCALPEMPDPCRSDCHGWGAHPLYHSFASIAGIRPAAPGFRRVRIRPMPGPLEHFGASMVHPDGSIHIAYQKQQQNAEFVVDLPSGIEGELLWHGTTHPLTGGRTRIGCRASAGSIQNTHG